MDASNEVTQLLLRPQGGDRSVLDRLAQAIFWRQRPNHTMQPTALVREAYVRLLQGGGSEDDS